MPTHMCTSRALWRVWMGQYNTPRALWNSCGNCARNTHECGVVFCFAFWFVVKCARTHTRECKEARNRVQQRSPSSLSRTHTHTHTRTHHKERETYRSKETVAAILVDREIVTDPVIKVAKMNLNRGWKDGKDPFILRGESAQGMERVCMEYMCM